MQSHSYTRVAFLRLHKLNKPLEVQIEINAEQWRWVWSFKDSNEATYRPTEETAMANIFLDERGVREHRD